MRNESVDHEILSDGTTKERMGTEAKDVLSKLKRGNRNALSRIKEGKITKEVFNIANKFQQEIQPYCFQSILPEENEKLQAEKAAEIKKQMEVVEMLKKKLKK